MIAVGLPNLIDTVRRDESAGVIAAMVAMLPDGTPPDDAEVARVLLAKGYTAGMIAEHLDAVIEAIIRRKIFVHIEPKDDCKHEFAGWREFEDGNGGESFCKYCGIGAMAYTLRNGP